MTSVKTNGVVEFRFFRADARAVAVAGDFTQWQEKAIPMQHEGNGWWVARVAFEPGEYRFRYVADGTWFTDFASHGVEVMTPGADDRARVSEIIYDELCHNIIREESRTFYRDVVGRLVAQGAQGGVADGQFDQ